MTPRACINEFSAVKRGFLQEAPREVHGALRDHPKKAAKIRGRIAEIDRDPIRDRARNRARARGAGDQMPIFVGRGGDRLWNFVFFCGLVPARLLTLEE
jgi:hypothetical protein